MKERTPEPILYSTVKQNVHKSLPVFDYRIIFLLKTSLYKENLVFKYNIKVVINTSRSKLIGLGRRSRELSGVGAGLTAELGVVGILIAEVGAHDQVAFGEGGLVGTLLGSLDLLHFDVDLVRNALVLIRCPVVKD